MSVLHRDKVELIQHGLSGAEEHAPVQFGRQQLAPTGAYSHGDTRDLRAWQADDIRPFW